MPTYDYRCMLCNEVTTLARAMEERDDEVKCDACGNPAARVFSSPGAIFKGGGFYSTDNPSPRRTR